MECTTGRESTDLPSQHNNQTWDKGSFHASKSTIKIAEEPVVIPEDVESQYKMDVDFQQWGEDLEIVGWRKQATTQAAQVIL